MHVVRRRRLYQGAVLTGLKGVYWKGFPLGSRATTQLVSPSGLHDLRNAPIVSPRFPLEHCLVSDALPVSRTATAAFMLVLQVGVGICLRFRSAHLALDVVQDSGGL